MNPKPIERAKNPLLALALPALIRARKRAEEVARATNTRLVQVVDGKIVYVRPPVRAESVASMPTPKRPARNSPNGTQFPPLPRFPKPPQLPVDPRQVRSRQLIGTLVGVAGSSMHVSGPNLSSGFHASAVDVGRLQAALERGLNRFSESQLESRWDEVFNWTHKVLRTWVQRCKQLRIERRSNGIRLELETQDDLGYYEYGFDVFPRRGTTAK